MSAEGAGLPRVEKLEKGKHWYRVYWQGVRPTRFTTTGLQDDSWRFSPFLDWKSNEVVQALYMGDSAMGAMAETVFRKDKNGAVLPSEVDARHVCKLSSTRDMQVAVLTHQFLFDKLGFNPVMNNDYKTCKEVALMLYHLYKKPIDGIVFPSYQTQGFNANLVVFNTRVKPGGFRVVANSKGQIYSPKYSVEFELALDASGRLLSDALRKKMFS